LFDTLEDLALFQRPEKTVTQVLIQDLYYARQGLHNGLVDLILVCVLKEKIKEAERGIDRSEFNIDINNGK